MIETIRRMLGQELKDIPYYFYQEDALFELCFQGESCEFYELLHRRLILDGIILEGELFDYVLEHLVAENDCEDILEFDDCCIIVSFCA